MSVKVHPLSKHTAPISSLPSPYLIPYLMMSVKVHHVSVVTPEFLKFLKGSVEMTVHVTQHISAPPDKIGTENAIVVDSIKTGEAKGCDPASRVDQRRMRLSRTLICVHSSRCR